VAHRFVGHENESNGGNLGSSDTLGSYFALDTTSIAKCTWAIAASRGFYLPTACLFDAATQAIAWQLNSASEAGAIGTSTVIDSNSPIADGERALLAEVGNHLFTFTRLSVVPSKHPVLIGAAAALAALRACNLNGDAHELAANLGLELLAMLTMTQRMRTERLR